MKLLQFHIFLLIAVSAEIVNSNSSETVTGSKMTWADVFRDRLEVTNPMSRRQQRSQHSTKKAFILNGYDGEGDHGHYALQRLEHHTDPYYGLDHSKESLLAASQAIKYLNFKDTIDFSKEKKALSYIYTESQEPQYVTETYKFVTAPQKYDAESFLHHAHSYHHKLQDYDHSEDGYASNYKFGYRVSDPHTGAEFGHSEVSEGHTKKGQYHVLLPDGRLQNVKYWADPSGYHATVTYEGQGYHYPSSFH